LSVTLGLLRIVPPLEGEEIVGFVPHLEGGVIVRSIPPFERRGTSAIKRELPTMIFFAHEIICFQI